MWPSSLCTGTLSSKMVVLAPGDGSSILAGILVLRSKWREGGGFRRLRWKG